MFIIGRKILLIFLFYSHMADNVVSETVLGSSGFFGRYGRGVTNSIKGIGGGFTSIALGFAIIYFTAGMAENSAIVQKLILTPAENITTAQTGLVKIAGTPTVTSPLIAPKSSEKVLYYKDTIEEFRKIEETTVSTKTVQKDGQDVQQQIESKQWVDKWIDKSDTTNGSKWASFSLGGSTDLSLGGKVQVEPQSSSAMLNAKTFFSEEKPFVDPNPTVVSQVTYLGKSVNSYPPTKTRQIVTGITADQPLIVIGEVNNGVIRSGKPFIVSNKTDAEILADLKSTEKMIFWITKGLAWLLIAGGLTAIIGPIFAVLDILPGLGGALKSIVFLVNGVIAAIIVFLGTLVIEYWYVALGILIALIALLFVMKKGKSATPSSAQ